MIETNTTCSEIRFADLFCGIGGFRIAADRVLKKHQVIPKCAFSCDIDQPARNSYFANFGENPRGDISKISSEEIPEHDILFAGFPCQPFSIIGKGQGFGDARGTLFFEILRTLEARRPHAFILENVKRLVGHDFGKTFKRILNSLNNLGYWVDYRVLNALDFGLPQKRERVFIVGLLDPPVDSIFPQGGRKPTSLSQILESSVSQKYFASEAVRNKRLQKHSPQSSPSIWHENKSGNISSYPYSCALRAGASHNYLLVDGQRRLTPREFLRLQGFPEWFQVVVSDSQIKKQTGNSVPIPVVESIFENILPNLLTSISSHKSTKII
jgi:DNA (cytosine-5)-methyltransferase 1